MNSVIDILFCLLEIRSLYYRYKYLIDINFCATSTLFETCAHIHGFAGVSDRTLRATFILHFPTTVYHKWHVCG